MRDFREFKDQNPRNDIIIQMALRDIDSEPFATALVDMDEDVREIFYRNMSKRACSFIKEDIRDRAEAAPEAIRAAQELLSQLLDRSLALYEEKGPTPPDPTPPPLDFGSREATIASLTALSEFARREGFLALEPVQASVESPLLRRGLIMMIEGWDPLLMRSILEKYKASWLRAMEIDYDLIIDGLESIASRDHSLVTEQKLRALVAGL